MNASNKKKYERPLSKVITTNLQHQLLSGSYQTQSSTTTSKSMEGTREDNFGNVEEW